MFWILYRHPVDKSTTLLETDNLEEATFVLLGVVNNGDAQLIDFCGDLDGVLDYDLDGVRLTDDVPQAV